MEKVILILTIAIVKRINNETVPVFSRRKRSVLVSRGSPATKSVNYITVVTPHTTMSY